MATRIYGVSVGDKANEVTEGVGSAVAADTVEVTVDLAATTVNTNSGQRAITKEEFVNGLKLIIDHVVKGNWPPA